MSEGIFLEGRVWKARKNYRNELSSTALSCGLYTNARGTLTHRHVLADIIPCGGVGYAPVAIAAANWHIDIELGTDLADDVAAITLDELIFTSNGAWPAITGAYLFDAATGVAIAWRDYTMDYPMPSGAKFRVVWREDEL